MDGYRSGSGNRILSYGNYLTNQTAKQKQKNKKKRSISLKKRANLKRIGNLVVYYIIVGWHPPTKHENYYSPPSITNARKREIIIITASVMFGRSTVTYLTAEYKKPGFLFRWNYRRRDISRLCVGGLIFPKSLRGLMSCHGLWSLLNVDWDGLRRVSRGWVGWG